MSDGDLDIAERHTGTEDDMMNASAKHVRMDDADPGLLTNRTDPPVGGASIEASPVAPDQDRSVAPIPSSELIVRAVRGTSRINAVCCPADDPLVAIPAIEAAENHLTIAGAATTTTHDFGQCPSM